MQAECNLDAHAQWVTAGGRSEYGARRMVPTVWIEQTTYRLQGGCSTTELCGQGKHAVELIQAL